MRPGDAQFLSLLLNDFYDRMTPPSQRTVFIDAFDACIRSGRRLGVMKPARLEKEFLLERAFEATGLTDFGDRWFEQPMENLLDSLLHEARLNAVGDWSAMHQFHHVLCGRLFAQMWYKRHPEIRDRPVPHPVVIVGPMRSGTTRLHRLLAGDRRFSHMRSFETISPVPRPGFEAVMEGDAEDFRPILAKRIIKVARLANPRTLSIHPTGAHEPEEELGLLVASMWGMKHEAQWHVPGYGRWCEGEDATPAYRYMADLLRLVSWSQGASSLRPWLLKTPQHALDLPALLTVFPDARLIFTHRDPSRIVGSTASLTWNQHILYSDHADAEKIGREWLRKTELLVKRMCATRRIIPAHRMIDVQYEDMERDWRGTMERVYRFLDLAIEPALPAMERYVDSTRALKRHPHNYCLQEFGLSVDEVRERMSEYVRALDIPVEGEQALVRRRTWAKRQ